MKMLRPAALALLIFSLVAAGLPVSDGLAHWARRPHAHRKAKHRRVKHSRAWWRRQRARIRQRQLSAARRRAARLSGNAADTGPAPPAARKSSGKSRRVAAALEVQGPRAPFDLTRPATWSSASAAAPGTMKFNVNAQDGRVAGTASIAPVSLTSTESATASTRTKSLSGVPFAALRRTVIDRMVLEGGWVVNDMERDLGGRRVYIVIAQNGSGGVARQSWTFYFTEMNGRLYSLVTTSALEFAAPLAADAEQVLVSLRTGGVGAIAVKSPR